MAGPLEVVRLVRLAQSSDPDRVAVVWAEPASSAGQWLLRLGRGEQLGQLTAGTSYGPYAEAELAAGAEELIAGLETEGFTRATDIDLILALSSDRAQLRGRAAVRLGWRDCKAAVGALVRAAETAKGDICPMVDALGWLGDPVAIDLARKLAERKNLSRRRSGVEALRNLGDAEGLAQALDRGLKRLPEKVVAALAAADEATTEAVTTIIEVIDDPRRNGLIADVLYERGTPLARAVALRLLTGPELARPNVWRYAKSVFKRTQLRRDAVAFARLAREIERASLTTSGTVATVKSGLTGKKHSTPVFGPKTQRYVLRAAWRHLRRLAKYQPDQYVRTAATILAHYGPEDLVEAKGSLGAQSRAFLFHRILHQKSDRFWVSWGLLAHRYIHPGVVERPAGAREEAFGQLWDAQPRWFVRLLLKARWLEVLEFAEDGLVRHPEALEAASEEDLLALVDRDRERTTSLVVVELSRRWDQALAAGQPALHLLDAVVARGTEALVPLASGWLEQSAHLWAIDVERLYRLLVSPSGPLRGRVGELAGARLAAAGDEIRRAAAAAGLEALRAGEAEPGLHAPLARMMLAGLSAELDELLDVDALLELIRQGSNSAKEVAGTLLAGRANALEVLGIEGLVGLADNEIAAVRRASHQVLARSRPLLEADPSILYALVESTWPDTRDFAFETLRGFHIDQLGLDGIIGLCDSTRPEVQALGRELVIRHFEQLSAETVLFRLSEHPAQHMRKFALQLIREHLRPGAVPLLRIEQFVRVCLFDPRPDRALKRELLELLVGRALADERQAEVVADLLAGVVRTQTLSDFDRFAQALARISVAYPAVQTDFRVRSEPAA